MPDAQSTKNGTPPTATRGGPLRLARTETILEARPKAEVPTAEEMFLSPRVLDAGAFARYAETLRSLIADARQGARDLQDFAADAEQMSQRCDKTGEQLRTRTEAGARVVKLIDERADRAERLLELARAELPDEATIRARIEPGIRSALESAQQRAAAHTLEIERRARATAAEIEQKLAAMSTRAADHATRLERAGEAIEQRLASLELRLASMTERAEAAAEAFETRLRVATESAHAEIEPALRRAAEATTTLDDALSRAWRHADERAGEISDRLGPLQDACDAVLERLGLDNDDTDPAGSVLRRLESLVERSESSLAGADRVFRQVDDLRSQAEGVKTEFGRWLVETAERVDQLEARREALTGPLTAAAEKVARVSPMLSDELEMASTQLDHLQTEQAILREAIATSAALAKRTTEQLNNQSAQMRALIEGSVRTLTQRVEEAGMWLGQLIMRAEGVAGRPPAPQNPAPQHHTAPQHSAPQAQAAPVQAMAAAPAPHPMAQPAPPPMATPTPAPAAPRPAPIHDEPITRHPLPPSSYGLPMPPSLPIDSLSFDGADVVFGREEHPNHPQHLDGAD